MGLNAKKIVNNGGGVQQEPIEPGTYPCRVVQVLDLGIQKQKPFQGKPKAPKHEIMLGYEFADEFCLDEDGEVMEDKPRWLSEDFPLNSLQADMAKSTKRYNAIDPKDTADGDFTLLISYPCSVTVSVNPGKGANAGKVYNNVASVATMRPKEVAKLPELVNSAKVFLLDEPDMEVFGSLPEWLQTKIKGNLEFNGSALQKALGETPTEPNDATPEEDAPTANETETNNTEEGAW